jgi:hypothetical protein
MANSTAWKSAERAWGAFLGGKRVPVTGRARGDAPDVGPAEEGQDWPWSIEVKYGKVLSSRTRMAMVQALAAAKEGQTPLVCITHREKGKRDNEHYVVLRAIDFANLVLHSEVTGLD